MSNVVLIPYQGNVPNGNKVIIADLTQNPVENHYYSVYVDYFDYMERIGRLRPGRRVMETTTGNAGLAFAHEARRRGYECIVMMPASLEDARVAAIRAEGACVILIEGDYVNALPEHAKEFRKNNKDVLFFNHSMGPGGGENRIVTQAMERIGNEILAQVSPHFVIVAIGNGSSILMTRPLQYTARVVTFESFQSGVGHDWLYPGEYKRLYGIDIGTLPPHKLYGTSYPGIPFPHIRIALLEERLVSETFLVSDKWVDKAYKEHEKREVPADIPRWDAIKLRPYGRSTRAGLAVAMKIAERERGKTIVFLAYDREDRYDPE